MKMLANPNNAIVLKMVMKMPPKNRKLPRLANNAEQLNETNTTAVPTRAVTTTAGSTEMTKSSSGPMVFPVKNPNPSNMPNRWLNAFGSSLDRLRYSANPIEPRPLNSPASQMPNKWTIAPIAAHTVVAVRQA